MDEVVEALSGGIVAELLYLLVGDLAAPFDRSAQRGIVVLCWIVPGVTALVEDDGLFCLIGILGRDDHAGPHRLTPGEGIALPLRIWALDFLLCNFPTPNPCRLLSAGAAMGQPAPKGFRPSSARRSLQAASSLMQWTTSYCALATPKRCASW